MRRLSTIVVIGTLLALQGCYGCSEEDPITVDPVSPLTFTPASISLQTGQSQGITANIPSAATGITTPLIDVDWTTNDAKIAGIDATKKVTTTVTCISAGQTFIQGTANFSKEHETGTVPVNCTAPPPPPLQSSLDGTYTFNITSSTNPCIPPITQMSDVILSGTFKLSWGAGGTLSVTGQDATKPGTSHFTGTFTNPVPLSLVGCSPAPVPKSVEGDLDPTTGKGTGTITFTDGKTATIQFTGKA